MLPVEIGFHNFPRTRESRQELRKFMRNIKKSNPERGWVVNSLSLDKIRCFIWNCGCFLCLLFCFLCLLFCFLFLLFWFQGDFCAPWGHHFETLAVSGNVLISPNPGASWSTTACMWIISATFGMMSLAREYEQIITRSKVTENDKKLQKVVEMSESERALENKLPSRQV